MKKILTVGLLMLSALAQANTRFYNRATSTGLTLGADDTAARLLDTVRGSSVTTVTKDTFAGPVTVPSTAAQFTINTSSDQKFSFLTRPLTGFTLSGQVSYNFWARQTSINANAALTAELLLVNNAGTSVISTISSVTGPMPELGTSSGLVAWTNSSTTTVVASGQRLAVRLYIDDAAGVTMASGNVVTFYYDGPSNAASGDSWIEISQDVTPGATWTPTTVATRTATPTFTVSATLTASRTASPTTTATPTASPTATPTFTPTPGLACLAANRVLAFTLTDANLVLTPTSGNAFRPVAFTIACPTYATAECEQAVYRVQSSGFTLVNALSIEQPAAPPSAPLGSATALLGCFQLPVNAPVTILYIGSGTPTAVSGTFLSYEVSSTGAYTWP